jgi:hypothetical protein
LYELGSVLAEAKMTLEENIVIIKISDMIAQMAFFMRSPRKAISVYNNYIIIIIKIQA